jgi:thiopeptide-type bacteriocin biosynthesis protein
MQECETLFHLDSQLVHDFIASQRTSGEPASVARRCWFGLLWVQQVLDAFFPDAAEKQQVLAQMATSFQTEFGFGSRQKAQLGARFRSYRAELEQLVWGRPDDAASLAQRTEWQALIAQYWPQWQATVERIRHLSAELETPLAQLVPSLIHMHCNRLFAANQRAHEVVFYDFLVRVIESERARTRVQTKHR